MKLSEVFSRSGIETDEKARRLTNTSTATANITASEIEDGVTIERLESIGVPVFRYSTQITIHGVLPGFSEAARPAGFRAVFQNQNGTVGVRYVALDGQKKRKIAEAARLGAAGWTARIDSTGLTLTHFSNTKEECLAAYAAFPQNLCYSSVQAGAGMLGGYYVFAFISAIPEANVWRFIGALWGIDSEAKFDALTQAKKAEYEAQSAEYEVQRKAQEAEKLAARKVLAERLTVKRLKTIPTGEGSFLYVSSGWQGTKILRYVIKKRGPALCCAVQELDGDESRSKFRKFEKYQREALIRDCAAGFVFEDAN